MHIRMCKQTAFSYGVQQIRLIHTETNTHVHMHTHASDQVCIEQVLEKIAFSYGIQRSVKISVMESMADSLIDSVRPSVCLHLYVRNAHDANISLILFK